MERLERLVFTHRRPLAALCAGVAVLLALGAVRSDPSGTEVVVAARDVPSGAVLTGDDLERRAIPADLVPEGSALDAADVVGRRAAGPLRGGEIVTDARIVDPHDLSAYDDVVGGTPVLSTVRVADPGSLTSVRPGDRLDVVALDPHGESEPVVVARRAVVAALPTGEATTEATTLSLVTDEETALALASASLRSSFTVVSHVTP